MLKHEHVFERFKVFCFYEAERRVEFFHTLNWNFFVFFGVSDNMFHENYAVEMS